MPSSLVDICFNFTHESFQKEPQALLQRAIDAGVGHMVVTGSTLEESRQGIELCALAPENLIATAGVHPHHANEWARGDERKLIDLARREQVKAIGECGLDFNRDYSPRPDQRYSLEAQLSVAAELGMPAFLHERDAHDDFVTIVDKYLPDLPAAVIHCFTGEASHLANYVAMGLHVGITGWICDERRGHHLIDIVGTIPKGRLMIETDAPYLLPRDLRPKPKSRRNEPAYLPHICAAVAAARGETSEETAEHTTKTALDFFNIESA